MSKLFLSFVFFLLLSCNNSNNTAETEAMKNADTVATKTYTWDSNDEKEFLAQCVETAKGNVNDTAAYAHCKCVLDQLKQVYPNMDSVAAVMDTAMAAKYAANCK